MRHFFIKKITVAILLTGMLFGTHACGSAVEDEVYTSVSAYEEILGDDGRFRQCNVGRNTVWPYAWSDSAEVETFYYRYYNPWDANYLGYLKLSFSDAHEYEKEIARLTAIEQSAYLGRYGMTGFSKELCAIVMDDVETDTAAQEAIGSHGMIYALTKRERQEVVYVVIDFCNYFSDIKDYDRIINAEDLPTGLDISESNPERKAFEEAR